MKSAAIIAKLLTKIINTSLAIGVVPDGQESTKVTPVFKKGEIIIIIIIIILLLLLLLLCNNSRVLFTFPDQQHFTT